MRWPALGSALFFLLAPGVVAGLGPWLLTSWELAAMPYALRVLGELLIAAGLPVLVHAFVRFVIEGRGTPAPVAPTSRVVVGGLYRWVRNPMYVAVGAMIAGQALLFGSLALGVYMALFCAAVATFVHGYEEPVLRARFGEEYERYRRAVPAWWPRLRPWRSTAEGPTERGGDIGVKGSACGPHTTQLTRFGLSNCYLVSEVDGLTLFDTSLRGSAGHILAAAARIGRPIRRIAITHAHHDHAGALESLVKRVPEAELAVGARESRLLRGDLTPQGSEPRGRLRGYLYEQTEVTPARLLAAGDRIGSLEVIAAPGHTPGHIAFLDTRDRTLLAGDAFIAVGELFVTTELVWRFPFPALSGTWHAPTAIEAARRLSEFEPSRIATGHGRVVEEPADEIARALRRARERKAWG